MQESKFPAHELLPCPFCGSKPKIDLIEQDLVYCNKCGGCVTGKKLGDTINNWNTRHSQQQKHALVKELAELGRNIICYSEGQAGLIDLYKRDCELFEQKAEAALKELK